MTTYAPIQDGFLDSNVPPWTGSGLWTEADEFFYVLGTLGPSGLVFQATPGVTFAAMSLTLTGELLAVGAGTLRLYLAASASPSLWSDANPPAVAGASLVASVAIGAVEIAVWTFTIDPEPVNTLAAAPGWSGRLAFALVFAGGAEGIERRFVSAESGDVASRPVLTTAEVAPRQRRCMRMPIWKFPEDVGILGRWKSRQRRAGVFN